MELGKLSNLGRKVIPCKSCGAVIVAAGSARRMGGVDKIMAELEGEPLILRTVRAFQETAVIGEIVIVTRPDLIVPISDLCQRAGLHKVSLVVAGGETRQASVSQGLGSLTKGTQLAAIADGARPLVSPQLIDRVVRADNTFGAAAPALPVKDTVKAVRADGAVEQTLDRSALRAVQTPQVFTASLLKAALQSAIDKDLPITDDCSAVELLGKAVYLTEGDEENLKITTPVDLILAEAILRAREERG